MAQKHLMWDIDGTLVLTGGAGQQALIDVIKEYYFLDAFQFQNSLAGRTDSDIVKEAVTFIRGRCHLAEVANLLIRYHMALPKYLPRCKGRVMKNVEPTLQYFQSRNSKYENCLLTGNTRMGAKLKLGHYGLDEYFNFDHSAFGELAEERNELARIALRRFYLADANVTPEDMIFIGDTFNDVLCARAIGSRCLIVLDGSSKKREEFESYSPWKVIDALPDNPAELERMLEEE